MNMRTLCKLLLATPVSGVIWLLLLFVFCFLGVHILRLAKFGWDSQKRKPPTPQKETPPEKKAPAPPSTAQEPVYYIVEKKKKRPKTSYGEPKEFRFK